MQAIGGNAAQPLGNAQATDTDVTGPNGTNGGDGGTITYFLHSGDVTSAGSAIVALSQGGT
ncbi:hypothetical protein, partial [Bacillus sp. SIMBA_074]|uniref:hypothetical protein n=1 Tax=Bacillus sp. SIMBA_074 TaxID=3085812 RepID=UPI00397DE934